MVTTAETLRRFRDDEHGQDMVEYALLLAFVAMAAVAVLSGVKSQINRVWSSISSTLVSASS